ncbi:hypothetical protein [Ornithinimicrobium faecis]|uniref:hypothetical protein n=1 Tax=Ornithinimicrobium faecis TaxID=2934158 RepID=UPI0021173E00|nr:hypothetical protein [Ornithinimicrobium sp. HY1745]
MSRPHVLQIGMDPDVIDFSPWPGQSAEALRGRIHKAHDELRDAGFDVTSCLLSDDAASAETSVRETLASQSIDVIEIGSGLRTSHDYTLIFELVVNTVMACQPGVRLCFNDSPETTLDAVRRGVRR